MKFLLFWIFYIIAKVSGIRGAGEKGVKTQSYKCKQQLYNIC